MSTAPQGAFFNNFFNNKVNANYWKNKNPVEAALQEIWLKPREWPNLFSKGEIIRTPDGGQVFWCEDEGTEQLAIAISDSPFGMRSAFLSRSGAEGRAIIEVRDGVYIHYALNGETLMAESMQMELGQDPIQFSNGCEILQSRQDDIRDLRREVPFDNLREVLRQFRDKCKLAAQEAVGHF